MTYAWIVINFVHFLFRAFKIRTIGRTRNAAAAVCWCITNLAAKLWSDLFSTNKHAFLKKTHDSPMLFGEMFIKCSIFNSISRSLVYTQHTKRRTHTFSLSHTHTHTHKQQNTRSRNLSFTLYDFSISIQLSSLSLSRSHTHTNKQTHTNTRTHWRSKSDGLGFKFTSDNSKQTNKQKLTMMMMPFTSVTMRLLAHQSSLPHFPFFICGLLLDWIFWELSNLSLLYLK